MTRSHGYPLATAPVAAPHRHDRQNIRIDRPPGRSTAPGTGTMQYANLGLSCPAADFGRSDLTAPHTPCAGDTGIALAVAHVD